MTITEVDVTRRSGQQSGAAVISLQGKSNLSKQQPPVGEIDKAHHVDATANNEPTLDKKTDDMVSIDLQADKVEGRVNSFDHVTFWVGNAKQSAVFYMTQFGFQPYAFRGMETGSRDVACHVVKLNDTVIQFVSAVQPNNRIIGDFLISHGDAVKDVAFRVENIEDLVRHVVEQGAELVHPLNVVTFDPQPSTNGNNKKSQPQAGQKSLDEFKCVLKTATIKTFGDVTHTFIERNYEYDNNIFLPGYRKPSLEVSICSLISGLSIDVSGCP